MQIWLVRSSRCSEKGLERRHGNAHHDNGSEYDGDHMKQPQDHPGESHDGACANNDVHFTAEQSDQFEERCGQIQDNVFGDGDEDVNALILEESGALAAV